MTNVINYATAKSRILTLVENSENSVLRTSPYVVFCTISPNPKLMLDVWLKGKNGKPKAARRAYGKVHQSLQVEYCMKHFLHAYAANASECTAVGCVEHNKSGNVHLHVLLHSPQIINDYWLDIFRREVSLDYRSIQNQGKHKFDAMNNIVRCANIDNQIDYLDKDFEKSVENGPYSNFYLNPGLNIPENIIPV